MQILVRYIERIALLRVKQREREREIEIESKSEKERIEWAVGLTVHGIK